MLELESSYDPFLRFVSKGATVVVQVKGGRKLMEAGLSLCDLEAEIKAIKSTKSP